MSIAAATANNTRGKILLNAASSNILYGIGYRDPAIDAAGILRNHFIAGVYAKTRLVVR
jgi:hypothetical protein